MRATQEAAARGSHVAVVGIPKTIDNDIQFIDLSFGYQIAFPTQKNHLATPPAFHCIQKTTAYFPRHAPSAEVPHCPNQRVKSHLLRGELD